MHFRCHSPQAVETLCINDWGIFVNVRLHMQVRQRKRHQHQRLTQKLLRQLRHQRPLVRQPAGPPRQTCGMHPPARRNRHPASLRLPRPSQKGMYLHAFICIRKYFNEVYHVYMHMATQLLQPHVADRYVSGSTLCIPTIPAACMSCLEMCTYMPARLGTLRGCSRLQFASPAAQAGGSQDANGIGAGQHRPCMSMEQSTTSYACVLILRVRAQHCRMGLRCRESLCSLLAMPKNCFWLGSLPAASGSAVGPIMLRMKCARDLCGAWIPLCRRSRVPYMTFAHKPFLNKQIGIQDRWYILMPVHAGHCPRYPVYCGVSPCSFLVLVGHQPKALSPTSRMYRDGLGSC